MRGRRAIVEPREWRGWAVYEQHGDLLVWTISWTRAAAIRKTCDSPYAAGRAWRQLYRGGWRTRRIVIVEDRPS